MSKLEQSAPKPSSQAGYFLLHTDGGIIAKPGQPSGEASIGIALIAPDGSSVHEISARIGWAKDHHVAEYRALIAGLRLALGHGVDCIRVFLDSAVVAGQVNGQSSVKPDLLVHLRQALALKEQFLDIEFTLVNRTKNKVAHKLADMALGRGHGPT